LGASSLRFADGSVVPAGATVKVNDEPTSLEALTIKEGLRLPAGPVIFGLSRTGYLPEEVRLTLDWGQEVSVNPQYAASGKYASRLGLEWGLYLNPEELELTRLDPTGREPRTQALWKAMGARIEKKEGPFWIYKVEEKVAAETGLKPGDQAQSISLPVPNTTKMQPPIPVAGKTPEELSKLLTGPLGRPVELTIVSAGQSARKITVMHRPALIPNPQPGQRWSFDLGYWLVPIAAGEFLMGGPWGSEPTDALPLTKVKLTEGFWISESEVTQALWEKITNSNPSKTKGSNLPVTNITFNEAKNFCRLLTERERNEGRLSEEYFFALPTEAQWEYAARAGTNINPTRAPDKKNGAEKNPALFQPMGWFYSNAPGVNIVQPVRTRQPNAWGVYDMLGNAWEWVDAEFKPYPGGEVTDYHEPARLNPVRRGGSVNNPPYYYYHWRVRDTMTGSGNTGLRIVLKKIARPASSGTR
jgi:formylglycine-generating enzyme required for sulfatase activity